MPPCFPPRRPSSLSRLGFPKRVTPFPDHPAEIALHVPLELRAARLSTGANIVGGEDYAAIDADMVDMESFAVVRACQRFGVPVMGLRGISDGPGDLARKRGVAGKRVSVRLVLGGCRNI